jgi:hypothetical protein
MLYMIKSEFSWGRDTKPPMMQLSPPRVESTFLHFVFSGSRMGTIPTGAQDIFPPYGRQQMHGVQTNRRITRK